MKLYAYRFINDEGLPTGYYGVVAANSEHDLFWNIDEFGDPYRCELSKLSSAGICFKAAKEWLDGDEIFAGDCMTNIEIGESFMDAIFDDKKFRKAAWSKKMIENLYSGQES
jgi:hypothetical protein